LVAKCFVGPYNIEAKMVSQGWALAYRYFSMDYVEEEAEAKKHKRGLWRGDFVAPWQWRQGKRSIISETPAAFGEGCQTGKLVEIALPNGLTPAANHRGLRVKVNNQDTFSPSFKSSIWAN